MADDYSAQVLKLASSRTPPGVNSNEKAEFHYAFVDLANYCLLRAFGIATPPGSAMGHFNFYNATVDSGRFRTKKLIAGFVKIKNFVLNLPQK